MKKSKRSRSKVQTPATHRSNVDKNSDEPKDDARFKLLLSHMTQWRFGSQ